MDVELKEASLKSFPQIMSVPRVVAMWQEVPFSNSWSPPWSLIWEVRNSDSISWCCAHTSAWLSSVLSASAWHSKVDPVLYSELPAESSDKAGCLHIDILDTVAWDKLGIVKSELVWSLVNTSKMVDCLHYCFLNLLSGSYNHQVQNSSQVAGTWVYHHPLFVEENLGVSAQNSHFSIRVSAHSAQTSFLNYVKQETKLDIWRNLALAAQAVFIFLMLSTS